MKLYIYKITAIITILIIGVSCEQKQEDDKQKSTKLSAGKFLSANFAESQNDYQHASESYKKMLHKDVANNLVRSKNLRILVIEGKITEALQEAKVAIKNDETHYLAALILALDAIKQGKYNEVQDILTHAFAKYDGAIHSPYKILTSTLLAWNRGGENGTSKYNLSNLNKPQFDESIAKYIQRQQAIIAYIFNDDVGVTKKLFDDILQTPQYNSYFTKNAISFFNKINDKDRARQIQINLYKSLNLQETDAKYQYSNDNLTGDIGADMKAHSNQAISNVITEISATHDKHFQDEIIMYLRLAQYMHNDDGLKIKIIRSLVNKKLYDNAITLLNEIGEKSEYYNIAQTTLATIYVRLDKAKKAISLLTNFSKTYPENISSLELLGDILSSEKEFDKAEKYYSKAINQIEKEEKARNQGAINKGAGSQGDVDKQAHWRILYARGVAFDRTDRWKKAEQDFRQSLQLFPSQPDVLNYLAYSWLIKDININKAEEMLRLALTLNPKNSHIIDSYGWALYKLKRYENALFFIKQAHSELPEDPTTNEHLGDVYWKLGRKREAKYQWERAMIFADDDTKQELSAKLLHGIFEE